MVASATGFRLTNGVLRFDPKFGSVLAKQIDALDGYSAGAS
jgi:hypothetical protein